MTVCSASSVSLNDSEAQRWRQSAALQRPDAAKKAQARECTCEPKWPMRRSVGVTKGSQQPCKERSPVRRGVGVANGSQQPCGEQDPADQVGSIREGSGTGVQSLRA